MISPGRLPSKTVLGAVLAAYVGLGAACGLFGAGGVLPAPGLPPDASTAQIDADQVVAALDAGWRYASTVCLDAQEGGLVPAGSCKSVLVPAEQAIQVAASAVDAWNAGGQGNFPCLAMEAVQALAGVDILLQQANVAVPSQLTDALVLAGSLLPACVASPQGGVIAPPAISGHATVLDAGGQ